MVDSPQQKSLEADASQHDDYPRKSLDVAYSVVYAFDQQEVLQLLQGCIHQGNIEASREIHSRIVEKGMECDSVLGSYLVRVYGFCDSLLEATRVFSNLVRPNVYAWDAIIAAHAKFGENAEAISLYYQMRLSSVVPDGHVFVTILQACTDESMCSPSIIHAHVVEVGLESNMFVCNALVCTYIKCGRLEDACRTFDRIRTPDVVTMSTLIAGLIQNGQSEKALCISRTMEHEGLDQDKVSFLNILKACTGSSGLNQGELIHARLIEHGLDSDLFICNTLVKMYGDCGSLIGALRLFERLHLRNVVTWSALFSALAQHGQGHTALECFQQMKPMGIEPDNVMHIIILKACSLTAALNKGKAIHSCLLEGGTESDVVASSALIDMYSKCGSLEDALRTFAKSPEQNLVNWNAIIAGLTLNGAYGLALHYFEDMLERGLQPDDVTFISILSACSHGGLVHEGHVFFDSMTRDHGVVPKAEHYNTMIDLLGRAGHLIDAHALLEIIPFQPNIVGWISLLNNCRTYKNVELGTLCFERVTTIDTQNSAAYVLISNIYMHAGMWEEAHRVEEQRKSLNAWKMPGKAYIEVNRTVHEFIVGDKNHPQHDQIYAELRNLSIEMKMNGYAPHLDLVLQLTSNNHKEAALCGHCEKQAIVFGLLFISEGAIRVSKNLRMCFDCHDAAKIMSNIKKREIVVIDAYRAHHFSKGTCSCKDYF